MIKHIVLVIILGSLGLSLDTNFSLQTKYGDGNKVKGLRGEKVYSEYKFLENILDINVIFDNDIFVSTQLEYSSPPVFGESVKGLNNFVIDYMADQYSIKAGNLYTLYGRGLSLNMTQNQNIDFDNSLVGIEAVYNYNDISIFGLIGNSEFKYRSNPVNEIPNLQLNNKVFFIGSEIFTQNLGTVLISYLDQVSKMSEEDIVEYWSSTLFDAGEDLFIRYPDIEPQGDDNLETKDLNFGWNYHLFGVDFYIEKVWNTYTRILGDTEYGSKLYASLYFDIGGTGITYEYKNYDQKYFIPTLSGAPIVYREGNSTLASRNSHSINWGDEVGHQIELNRSIGSLNWLGNLSFSHKHDIEDKSSNFINTTLNVIGYDKSIENYTLYPFRQFFSELSGYVLDEKFYFKFGIDQLDKVKKDYGTLFLSTSAYTVPTMFTLNLGSGNSITSYIEYQEKETDLLSSELSSIVRDFYIQKYFSLTYNYSNFISLSLFYEDETHEDSINKVSESDYWRGYDLTAELNSTSQVSIFYGSQKGGLVCANGVCAEQPGFDNGVKITLRTIF